MSLNIGMSLSGPTIGISPDFREFINVINKKRYIRKSRIDNIHFPFAGQSTMSWELRGDYKHGFYAFSSIAFEGEFGPNPDVFMLFSKNDNLIEFNSKEHSLNDDDLTVVKLKKNIFKNNKYEYGIEKELNYYSNSESEYDIRPFIIVVFGEDSLGFATITLINKSSSAANSNRFIGGTMPGTGVNPFQPQARKLVWPTGKDLLRTLKEPQTGRSFRLDKEQVDNILNLKRYFINLLEPNIAKVLKEEYITEWDILDVKKTKGEKTVSFLFWLKMLNETRLKRTFVV